MLKNYQYDENVKLSTNFSSREFRCKCGKIHMYKVDTDLVSKLQKLADKLNVSKVIINSGYRCSAHDKNVGGSGWGQHVAGAAADIVCYDKNNKPISSKLVSCAAQDVGFTGIANIDKAYTATHVDVRSSAKWYGDETVTTTKSVTNDFYSYYGIAKTETDSTANLNKELQTILNADGGKLTVDGIIGPKTLAELKLHAIYPNDKGELVKWVQRKLDSKGFNCGSADGIAGAKTMNAIHDFQNANGLGVGYLGGHDWDLLVK